MGNGVGDVGLLAGHRVLVDALKPALDKEQFLARGDRLVVLARRSRYGVCIDVRSNPPSTPAPVGRRRAQGPAGSCRCGILGE
jgi:hypothetical protein